MSFDTDRNLTFFKALQDTPGEQIDLSRAALMVAAWNYPDIDVDAEIARLDELGHGARDAVQRTTTLPERLEALVRFLSDEQKFRGNIEEYYDPRNSFLNDVIARRCGLPITLAIIYIHVARVCGVELKGVAAPGHFIARAELASGEPLFVDPFYGLIISEKEVRERYRSENRGEEELPDEILRPVDNRRILIRLLTNLKYMYIAQDDADRALECCERSLALDPNSKPDLRDRGLMLLDRESFRAGIADLKRYLELAPNDLWSESVRTRLARAERLMDTLN